MVKTATDINIARVITREEVDRYAELTGDYNPIHFGENAIVHGGLLIGRISAMVWRTFGDGTRARGIDKLRFDRPIYPGEQFFISLGDPVPLQGRTRLGEQIVQVTVTKICKGQEKDVASGEIIVILST
ncbi:MAG: MaoC family dehydratase [Patescibacteria group bacterium]